VEHAEHIEEEHYDQDGAQPDARTSAITPTTMAVVPATATQEQQQQYKQYQHLSFSYSFENLLLEDLFYLADLFLDLAGDIFHFAFSFQVGIVGDLTGRLLDFALHFVKLAFDLIVRARIHLFFSLFAFTLRNWPSAS
jgi:hypothetical protein